MNAICRILEWPVAANDDVPLALWSAAALAEAAVGVAAFALPFALAAAVTAVAAVGAEGIAAGAVSATMRTCYTL